MLACTCVSVYTGHDCSGDYLHSLFASKHIYLCFLNRCKVQLCFPRWYQKTAVLNSNSCRMSLPNCVKNWSCGHFSWFSSGWGLASPTELTPVSTLALKHSSSVGLPLSFSGKQLCHQDTSFKQNLPFAKFNVLTFFKRKNHQYQYHSCGARNDLEQKWFIQWLRNHGDSGYPHSEGGRERMNELKHVSSGAVTCCFWSVIQKCAALFEFWKWGVFLSTNKPTLQLLLH